MGDRGDGHDSEERGDLGVFWHVVVQCVPAGGWRGGRSGGDKGKSGKSKKKSCHGGSASSGDGEDSLDLQRKASRYIGTHEGTRTGNVSEYKSILFFLHGTRSADGHRRPLRSTMFDGIGE